MALLRCRVMKKSITKAREDACIRNGPRHALFTIYRNGRKRYSGEWKNDMKHGKGTELDERTGMLYEGFWAEDLKSGYGELSKVLHDNRHKRVYMGNWLCGKRDGFGRAWYNDGRFYEGYFRANKKHGFGRIWHRDGTFYQGTWEDDRYHGEGMLVLENGNRYEGLFYEGKKEGPGVFYHLTTGQMQEGFWLEDKCVMSTIEDICWRQSAQNPSFYPIPKVSVPPSLYFSGLDDLQARMRIFSINGHGTYSSSAKYEDYVGETVEC